jgi:uncharacterized protein YwqG
MKPHLEPLLKQLRDYVVQQTELSAINLAALALHSVRLITQHVPQSRIDLGESRIGGTPDLPAEVEWPRWLPSNQRDDKFGEPWHPERPVPLGFIAQIDLQDVPRLDHTLPSKGMVVLLLRPVLRIVGI